MGFEPTTASLEGWNSTTELRPQLPKYLKQSQETTYISINNCYMVGRQGFEPWKPMAADLQSAPVVHLGTCPL